jgi:hypothetical protein
MPLVRTLPALIVAFALCPAAAFAQVPDADVAVARDLAQQGQDALDRKDFATAADRFARAGDLVHAPTLALGLARAEVGLGKWIAAQERYNRILREGAPAGAPPAFARAVAAARRELDALAPRIPSVVILVSGAGSARVTLDGAPVRSAALGISRPVDPGVHTFRAEADGFAPVEVTTTIAEHRAETVTLKLEAGRAGAPVDPWSPGVDAPVNPWNAHAGAPPAAPPPAASNLPPPTPAQGSSIRRTLGFVGIGVGGAGLAMGLVTGGVALGKHGSLAKLCPDGQCINQESAVDSYHVMTTLSTAGFVAGGVLAATGVVLLVTAPRPSATENAWIAPIVGAGYVGAEGSF